jgi:hypothetical protein
MTVPDAKDIPPVLGLAFQNAEPALAIFRGLRERFGWEDKDNNFRVAIIRGVWSSNPHAYAVVVGPGEDQLSTDADRIFKLVSRIVVMTPSSSQNLALFLAEYGRHGRYLLAAAHLPSLDGQPRPMMDTALGKYHLIVREAWEIGDNDPDLLALDPDDPPVIPADHPDAPALRAIDRLRAWQRRKSARRGCRSRAD